MKLAGERSVLHLTSRRA